MFMSFIQLNFGVEGGRDWPAKIAVVCSAWFVFYVFCSYSIYRTIYLFSNAYLLAIAMFHLGVVYLLAFGSVEESSWTRGSFSQWLETAGWYVVMAFGSYGIGLAFAGIRRSPSVVADKYRPIYTARANRFLFQQGVGLLIASFIFILWGIKSYGNIFAYSRQDLYGQGPDSRGLRVFMMVFPSALLLLTIAAQSKKQRVFGYTMAGLGIFLFMISGYRSAALFPMLLGAVLWVKSGRKIPVSIAVGAIAGVLVAISVVGIFRQMGSYGELGSQQLSEAYEESSVERSIAEMGGTIGVLAHTLRLVPEVDYHTHGASYWLALKGMFPNIGFSIDTSSSRMELGDDVKMDKSQFARMAPSSWLTYRIKPAQFEKGGGVGFSAIAEPYLNFGVGGVVMIFIILGYFLGRLDRLDLIANKYTYLFVAAMLWPLIRTVRNDFANFLKPMGFMIIILLLWNIALEILGRRAK